MFKFAMMVLILLLVSMNAVEEELHEYLALFAAAVFFFHVFAQKWWLSGQVPRWSRALRMKSLSAVVLFVVFAFTMLSGLLLSRYTVPAFRVKALQAIMIEVHHGLGTLFLLLSFFHFGLHLSMKKIRALGLLKVVGVSAGLLSFYSSLRLLPDFIYSDFGWSIGEFFESADPRLVTAALVPLTAAVLGLILNTISFRSAENA